MFLKRFVGPKTMNHGYIAWFICKWLVRAQCCTVQCSSGSSECGSTSLPLLISSVPMVPGESDVGVGALHDFRLNYSLTFTYFTVNLRWECHHNCTAPSTIRQINWLMRAYVYKLSLQTLLLVMMMIHWIQMIHWTHYEPTGQFTSTELLNT